MILVCIADIRFVRHHRSLSTAVVVQAHILSDVSVHFKTNAGDWMAQSRSVTIIG